MPAYRPVPRPPTDPERVANAVGSWRIELEHRALRRAAS